MTQSLPPPQDLAAATFRGWGELSKAWMDAAQRWWFTIVEWAVDECSYTGVNQTAAYAVVGKTAKLRGEFHRVDDPSRALIADTCVTIGQTTDAALAKIAAPTTKKAAPKGAVLLVVTIRPSTNVQPGEYRGHVVNVSTKKIVADSLYIYVATDSPTP